MIRVHLCTYMYGQGSKDSTSVFETAAIRKHMQMADGKWHNCLSDLSHSLSHTES